MRIYTIDSSGDFHFSMTNTFADVVMGEKRRIRKVFSYSSLTLPDIVGERWLKNKFISIYGKDRGIALFHHPKLVTKMKWGCGVTARFQDKLSCGKIYPVFRLSWNEYDPINKRSIPKAEYLTLTKFKEGIARNKAIHEMGIKAARIRAELSMSELDEGILNVRYDLEAMPETPFSIKKPKHRIK